MNLFSIVGLFVLSFLLGRAVISVARHLNLGADSSPGVQRFHSHWVPRLGGVPIFVALALWILLIGDSIQPDPSRPFKWILCLLPAFAAGLVEDLTARVGSWPRLLATMTGAAIAWWLIDVQIVRLGPDLLDGWLAASPLLSLAITVLFVGGGAHALNIIDGYNGLAGSYAILVLFAILMVASRVDDIRLMYLSAGAIAATLGFFVLNFPYGRIFLGDSGAYLLGTVIGYLLAVLVYRNPEVSPMFAAVLLVYPVWETLFSIYRKKILRGTSPMQPDGMHLHMLIYKRLVRTNQGNPSAHLKIHMNSATTLYTLTLSAITIAFAITFWRSTAALFLVFAIFIAAYMALYFALVRFRSPPALSLRAVWASANKTNLVDTLAPAGIAISLQNPTSLNGARDLSKDFRSPHAVEPEH